MFSGFWFRRWAKIYMQNFGLVGEDRIWPGLGWFSGLMCAGSVVGAAAWVADMQVNAVTYERHATAQQAYLQNAALFRWTASFNAL